MISWAARSFGKQRKAGAEVVPFPILNPKEDG